MPIITPCRNKTLDLFSFKKLSDFLIGHGVDAVFILGTNGEFQFLNLAEKETIIRAAVSIVDTRVQLLVGISAPSLSETEQLLEMVNQVNAVAVVLAPLFGQGEAREKINLVLKRSRLPVLLYNNPHIQNNKNLDLAIIKELARNKKIIGIKDSSGNMDYFTKLLKLVPAEFGVYQGDERLLLDSLDQGAAGVVCGSANVYPAEFKLFYSQRTEELMAKVLELRRQIISLSPNFVYDFKTRLKEAGIIKTNELYS